jgi:hypothetical protein
VLTRVVWVSVVRQSLRRSGRGLWAQGRRVLVVRSTGKLLFATFAFSLAVAALSLHRVAVLSAGFSCGGSARLRLLGLGVLTRVNERGEQVP